MKGQSKRGSIAEAIINVLVGFGINMLANFTIFPLFGWQITLEQNLLLGVFYTVISLVRSYFLRRAFNWFDFGRCKDSTDDFLCSERESDPLLICVVIAAVVLAIGGAIGMYEVTNALIERWA